jgi:hypothetical protein
MLAVIFVTPVVDTPAFDRIAKLPAVPRATGAGPAAIAAFDPIKPSTMNAAKVTAIIAFRLKVFVPSSFGGLLEVAIQ